jgi:hypothetical protein
MEKYILTKDNIKMLSLKLQKLLINKEFIVKQDPDNIPTSDNKIKYYVMADIYNTYLSFISVNRNGGFFVHENEEIIIESSDTEDSVSIVYSNPYRKTSLISQKQKENENITENKQKLHVLYLEMSTLDCPCTVFIGVYSEDNLEKGKKDAESVYLSNDFYYDFIGSGRPFTNFLVDTVCELNVGHKETSEC